MITVAVIIDYRLEHTSKLANKFHMIIPHVIVSLFNYINTAIQILNEHSK